MLLTIDIPVLLETIVDVIGAVPAKVTVANEVSVKLTIAGVDVTTPDAVVEAVLVFVIVIAAAVEVITEFPVANVFGIPLV